MRMIGKYDELVLGPIAFPIVQSVKHSEAVLINTTTETCYDGNNADTHDKYDPLRVDEYLARWIAAIASAAGLLRSTPAGGLIDRVIPRLLKIGKRKKKTFNERRITTDPRLSSGAKALPSLHSLCWKGSDVEVPIVNASSRTREGSKAF